MDFSGFFSKPATLQAIEREFVTEEDVVLAPDRFILGSEGAIKSISIVDEKDVDKIGSTIQGVKKVFYFSYKDPDFPQKHTGMELKREGLD